MRMKVHSRVPTGVILGTAIAIVIAMTLRSTSSSAGVDGTVYGTVVRCGPGTVVSVPGKQLPTPTPTFVVLVRDNRTFSSNLVKFESRNPWTAAFEVQAPAGSYEVIVALPGYQVSWITVTSGDRSIVTFKHYACPV